VIEFDVWTFRTYTVLLFCIMTAPYPAVSSHSGH